jgi:hypothetical protein
MNTVVWYKVRHPWFDPTKAYRAVDYVLHSESAWGYLVFVLPKGHTVSIQVHRCTALPRTCEMSHIDHTALSRDLTETEFLFEWAKKPPAANPDLNLDMQ